MELLEGNNIRFFNEFRMPKVVFYDICHDLSDKYSLVLSRDICVEEVLAMTLKILGHGDSNRSVAERFQHSGETVSMYFKQCLKALIRMSLDIIRPIDPTFASISKEISSDDRYMPYFKVNFNLLFTLFFKFYF
ncbi:hypothetical protein AXF42_Ash011825 [Apostasia shenzhenica]|uniref:DUF8040 domain-containing protein n=1 Tax=Apostasia shenzhenica TaxID=1088818 RepID=A0A2I0AVZ1_9ASPA|nr:hypothetical protein AXF42_Ash011825 [Apostasia shenzhenica]